MSPMHVTLKAGVTCNYINDESTKQLLLLAKLDLLIIALTATPKKKKPNVEFKNVLTNIADLLTNKQLYNPPPQHQNISCVTIKTLVTRSI